jgi:hypothetical protein
MARALYIDDAVTTCDCCGREGLKKTVAILLDCGGIVHYGTTCAGRNIGKDQRQIKQEIIKEQNDNAGRASNEWRSTDECRAMCVYRMTAPWKEIGWDAYMESDIVKAAEAKRKEIAAKYHTLTTLF